MCGGVPNRLWREAKDNLKDLLKRAQNGPAELQDVDLAQLIANMAAIDRRLSERSGLTLWRHDIESVDSGINSEANNVLTNLEKLKNIFLEQLKFAQGG